VNNAIKNEMNVLTESLLSYSELFVPGKLTKDLVISFEDILTKCLEYIEFWDVKNANKDSILFLIKANYRIIEKKIEEHEEHDDDDDDDEKMLNDLENM